MSAWLWLALGGVLFYVALQHALKQEAARQLAKAERIHADRQELFMAMLRNPEAFRQTKQRRVDGFREVQIIVDSLLIIRQSKSPRTRVSRLDVIDQMLTILRTEHAHHVTETTLVAIGDAVNTVKSQAQIADVLAAVEKPMRSAERAKTEKTRTKYLQQAMDVLDNAARDALPGHFRTEVDAQRNRIARLLESAQHDRW